MSISERLSPPLDLPRIIPKPRWLVRLEGTVARFIPLHPNSISSLKLLVVVPIILALNQVGVLAGDPWLILPLMAVFLLLDYLDGVVARENDKASSFGRIFDRLTDLPLLIPVALFCCATLPTAPVLLKLGLDLVLLALFCLGRGPVENRIRSIMSYSTLLVMVIVSQGWWPHLVTPRLALGLVWLNVCFSGLVILIRLGLFRRRNIADALSCSNLLCGVGSIAGAVNGHLSLCLFFLVLGILFDGLDGAAARRWGSTPWGVYSDDVADAVSYGLAPGVVLISVLGGIEGWILGVAYAALTLCRLVFFTLGKDSDDPEYFGGLPSPAAGLMVISGAVLFSGNPVMLGATAAAAFTLMVVFESRFRHLGRLLSRRPKLLLALLPAVFVLAIGILWWGPAAPALGLFLAGLSYGFYPVFKLLSVRIRHRRKRARGRDR